MPVKGLRIPKSILLPIAHKARTELKTDPGKFSDDDVAYIREQCGPTYASYPLADIRWQFECLRKNGDLPPLFGTKNHGAKKREPEPNKKEYERYLQGAWWRRRRIAALEYYGYACAIDKSKDNVEVHHNTYERCGAFTVDLVGSELDSDLVPLCKSCHTRHSRYMKRLKRGENGQTEDSNGDGNGDGNDELFFEN